jgi:hypothetical protein
VQGTDLFDSSQSNVVLCMGDIRGYVNEVYWKLFLWMFMIEFVILCHVFWHWSHIKPLLTYSQVLRSHFLFERMRLKGQSISHTRTRAQVHKTNVHIHVCTQKQTLLHISMTVISKGMISYWIMFAVLVKQRHSILKYHKGTYMLFTLSAFRTVLRYFQFSKKNYSLFL